MARENFALCRSKRSRTMHHTSRKKDTLKKRTDNHVCIREKSMLQCSHEALVSPATSKEQGETPCTTLYFLSITNARGFVEAIQSHLTASKERQTSRSNHRTRNNVDYSKPGTLENTTINTCQPYHPQYKWMEMSYTTAFQPLGLLSP
jgi:hypothetical protein